MSLAVACGWTLLRSFIVAMLAVPVCWKLEAVLDSLPRAGRRTVWFLLAAAFLAPELLIGYAYSNFQLSLVRYPALNESLYGFLVLLKVIPVGVAVARFSPAPPVSSEALHIHRLSGGGASFSSLIRGPARIHLCTASVVFLLSFQEFEMASFFATASWTVWLYDQQVGGLMLSESLRFAIMPVVTEALVLVPLVLLATQGNSLAADPEKERRPQSRTVIFCLLTYLPVAIIALIAIPFAIMGSGILDGLRILLTDTLQRNGFLISVATAAGFAVPAAILSHSLAGLLLNYCVLRRESWKSRAWIAAACLPGLFGSLSISLALVALFQIGLLNPLYDTIIPLMIGTTLFLLPRAVLLRLLLNSVTSGESSHLAAMLTDSPISEQRQVGRRLIWHERYRRQLGLLGVLYFWGYMELTLAALLAPVGMIAAPVRLYAQMHYGRNEVLSATSLLTVMIPVAAFFVVVGIIKLIHQSRS
ncbi:MAG: hypothetical protein CMJ78_13590 [Planctomycetaceae bacterium]|nr:hypothetical protein [Planctomycetaceae bacterium]